MSTPNWLSISKNSGSGNDSVTVTATSANTGKTSRSAVVSGVATGGGTDSTVVTQSAKAAYVQFNQAAYSINAGVQTITVSGKTNCTSLQFSLQKGGHFTFPQSINYTLAGDVNARTATLDSNTRIATPSGNPGAEAEYNFSVTLTCPANTSAVNSVVDTLTVVGDSNNSITDSCTLTHNTADSSLEMTSAVTLGQTANSTGTIVITSNDSWTLSLSEQ